MKTRDEKDQDIALLQGEFCKVSNALMISFQGLTVEKDWELRRALREAKLDYRVVKNTLGRRAVEGTALEPLKDHFKGMTGVAYSASDPVSLAKVLTNFAKENTKVTFKGGVVDGRPIEVKDIEALSKLPSKEELISKLMFVINAPAQRMAVALNGVARNLAVVVSEIAKQKGA
ncbi:MAG: 50S ribosomal protein L10 [Acidobacteria bacterium]|nr:50S ribosomal protein L10 [Acidobacteriota bacterium]